MLWCATALLILTSSFNAVPLCRCFLLLVVLLLQALASRVQPGPGGVGSLLVEQLPGLDAKALQEAALSLLSQLPEPAAVLLASTDEADASGKVSFVAALSPQVRLLQAVELLTRLTWFKRPDNLRVTPYTMLWCSCRIFCSMMWCRDQLRQGSGEWDVLMPYV